jgi:hypothetical protein
MRVGGRKFIPRKARRPRVKPLCFSPMYPRHTYRGGDHSLALTQVANPRGFLLIKRKLVRFRVSTPPPPPPPPLPTPTPTPTPSPTLLPSELSISLSFPLFPRQEHTMNSDSASTLSRLFLRYATALCLTRAAFTSALIQEIIAPLPLTIPEIHASCLSSGDFCPW